MLTFTVSITRSLALLPTITETQLFHSLSHNSSLFQFSYPCLLRLSFFTPFLTTLVYFHSILFSIFLQIVYPDLFSNHFFFHENFPKFIFSHQSSENFYFPSLTILFSYLQVLTSNLFQIFIFHFFIFSVIDRKSMDYFIFLIRAHICALIRNMNQIRTQHIYSRFSSYRILFTRIFFIFRKLENVHL